jgi:hypothetical protein
MCMSDRMKQGFSGLAAKAQGGGTELLRNYRRRKEGVVPEAPIFGVPVQG